MYSSFHSKSSNRVATSLLYTDVSPKNKYFITLNQWFDQSLLDETDMIEQFKSITGVKVQN